MLALLALAALSHAADGKWITVEASAYCPCSLCCDKRTERTADGTNTRNVPYGVAASPDLPLGSKIYIPPGAGYLDDSRKNDRVFTIDDRGGLLRSEWRRTGITRIDLRYKHHWSAQQFGRKLMMVYVEEGTE
jgi:3D (Asp-Asp-Asp) domain-containing protein